MAIRHDTAVWPPAAVISGRTWTRTRPRRSLAAGDRRRRPGGRAPTGQPRTGRSTAAGPLAVKLLDADVTHKSDVGGVHLGVRDAADLDAALDALEAAGAARFLVESMAPAGVDLIVGAPRDPVFGPVVLVGLGGVVAEALADVAVAPAPLTAEAAAAGRRAGRPRPARRLPRRPGRRPHRPGPVRRRARRPARRPPAPAGRRDQPAAVTADGLARARRRADPRHGVPSDDPHP